MLIKVYGKDNCKDCSWQKASMKAFFNPSEWTFIDGENGIGKLEADKLDIKILPAIVVLNDAGVPIIIKEGKIAAQELKKEIFHLKVK